MPNQYSASDFNNVPRTYYYTGSKPIGSQPGSGFLSFQAGLRADATKFNSITDQTYPHADGSYAPGLQRPFGSYNPNVSSDGDYLAGSGMFIAGSGLNVFSSVKFAYAEGSRVNEVDYPGYLNSEPLDASGITHTFYNNPNNTDPYLDSDV